MMLPDRQRRKHTPVGTHPERSRRVARSLAIKQTSAAQIREYLQGDTMSMPGRLCFGLLLSAAAIAAGAADNLSETPANFSPRVESFDYVKREVMIPMRDGVKLHTIILVPKGAAHAGMLLTRTLTVPSTGFQKRPAPTWPRSSTARTWRTTRW